MITLPRMLRLLALGALLPVLAVPASGAGEPSAARDGRHDFDFFYGRWTVHNRRLLTPLQGSDDWEQFEAANVCRPVLGGIGNQDEYLSPHRPGFVGMSLRLFDLQSRRWSIYWIDNRGGVLQPPVVGHFAHGVGVFEGPDAYGGQPIRVRYTWSRIDTPTPHWEQAFSLDDGKTWETNWIMDFARTPAAQGAAQ